MFTVSIHRSQQIPFPIVSRVAIFVVAMACFANAAGLSATDKDEGMAQLNRTRAMLMEATKDLSDAQWNFKPAPDKWSILEVLEHIVLTEDALRGNIVNNVLRAPVTNTSAAAKADDGTVLSAVSDRSTKAKAPAELVPTGRWSAKEAQAEFLKSRKRTLALLQSRGDLREHAVESPLGKNLDGYQWILLISAHSERHTKQILEVKADAGFPED